MTSLRKSALIGGALYVATFVTSIPALGLKSPARSNPAEFVLGVGSGSSVVWAGVLDVLCALTGIGTAVALYRVAKRQSRGRAAGFIVTRSIEAAIIIAGVVSLFVLVGMRDGAATGAHAAQLGADAKSLIDFHDWTFLLGPGVMPAFNAMCLAVIMYRSRLVPRIIPTLGLVGAPLLLISAVATMFGAWDQVSSMGTLMALPIAAWEGSLGVYLVAKGFKPSPVTDGMDEADGHVAGYRPVAA